MAYHGDWNDKVEFEGEDCARQQHNEHYVGRILKVRQLNLQI